MTDVTGGQWKLMLEIRSQSSHFSLDSEINSLGYIDIDARSIPPHTILDGTGNITQCHRSLPYNKKMHYFLVLQLNPISDNSEYSE